MTSWGSIQDRGIDYIGAIYKDEIPLLPTKHQ